MRSYELTVILQTDEELYRKTKEIIAGTLKQQGAEIAKEEELGEKQLAYEVKGNKRGRYVIYFMKMAPDKVIAAEKVFKLDTNILKYLFVRAED